MFENKLISPIIINLKSLKSKKNRDRKIICIYKITSKYGGIYIGKTIDLESRFLSYKRLNCKEQQKIYNSLKKYGIESHTFEIIHIVEKCELNKLDISSILSQLEIYYIKKFNSFKDDNPEFGLNMTVGGDGIVMTDEIKKKISESNKGFKNGMYGKKQSKEARKKISDAGVGRFLSKESREKISNANKGKNNPNFGKKLSLEHKNVLLLSRLGKRHTEESKKKISESHLGEKNYWYGKKQSKEHIEKRIKNNRGKKYSKEHKEKISLSRKIKFLTYNEARKFVIENIVTQGIDNFTEWNNKRHLLPKNIPKHPSSFYKNNGWLDWRNWFGKN